MSPANETVARLVAEFDSREDLLSTRLTSEKLGSVYIPESLHSEFMHCFAFRKEEFVKKVVRFATSGNPEAVSLLAMLFYNGVLDSGRQRLLKARGLAQIGDHVHVPYATYILGCISLEEAQDGDALSFFEKAASQGFGPALWMLGVLYESGRGAKADVSKAADYFFASGMQSYVFGYQQYARIAQSGALGGARMILAWLLWPLYLPIHKLRVRFSSLVYASHLVPVQLSKLIKS